MDESASDITRYSDGRIMLVDRYAFRADAVPSEGRFTLPGLLNVITFCTERTARMLQERLTGLDLRLA